MHTPFVQLHFRLQYPGGPLMPHALFAIKQLFPAAFRRAVGCSVDGKTCRGGTGCPCRRVFDQQLTADPAALRRYQKPPLPFAFTVPVLSERNKGGGETELSLVVVGEAISHLDLFIAAVRLVCASLPGVGSLTVSAIELSAADGSRQRLPLSGCAADFPSLPLLSLDELFSVGGTACARVSLRFLTPVRLLHRGVPLREIQFSAVAGALFRRISALAYYYGHEELPCDFKWLAAQSREIVCRNSELHWVNRGGGLQGVEGEVSYRGDLTEFMPFLSLGSRLNIGKGATYGMGAFSVAFD